MSRRYAQGAAVVTAEARVMNRAERRRAQIEDANRPRAIVSEAHRLALANKHKPWARRWLRAHREFLCRNGMIEISL